jgi:hypothetical protein
MVGLEREKLQFIMFHAGVGVGGLRTQIPLESPKTYTLNLKP